MTTSSEWVTKNLTERHFDKVIGFTNFNEAETLTAESLSLTPRDYQRNFIYFYGSRVNSLQQEDNNIIHVWIHFRAL